ncbi:MAG: ATPase, partial [Actinobacteria bacterium]
PLLADLALSDLVLWLPTWNEGGLVAVAQVRPTTAPTRVPDGVIGDFAPRGRFPDIDQALAFGQNFEHAYPVHFGDRVIAVVARHSSGQPRVAGKLEEIYLETADDLLRMLVEGTFPARNVIDESADAPRVGDGLIRLDENGMVTYSSPNAVSALHRLGLATDVEGKELKAILSHLSRRPSPMDETLMLIASGQAAGRADIENNVATVLVQGIPLQIQGSVFGSLVLVRDVTDIRGRELALLSKDATIREIHHRVKNNLQTVAALLRLQGRRAASAETKAALGEAELRVGAIAVVHEILSRDTGETVAFDEIIDRIIGLMVELASAFATQAPLIRRVGSCGALPSEQVTPLAMSISELLQNAVEHAHAASITVELAQGDGQVQVVVRDDGIGLPSGFAVSDAGLGLQIVESLATGELRGKFLICNGETGGAMACIEIPQIVL